jgi:hypothetical protein
MGKGVELSEWADTMSVDGDGNVTITGDLTFESLTSVGPVDITGDTQITGTLDVTGQATFDSAFYLPNNTSIRIRNAADTDYRSVMRMAGTDRIVFQGESMSFSVALETNDGTADAALILSADLNADFRGDIQIEDTKAIDFGNVSSTSTGTPGNRRLVDYEEGTFEPVLTCAVPGDLAISYNINHGTYTKIGNSVTFALLIECSSFTHTTAAGIIQVTGLPFTAANDIPVTLSTSIDEWTAPVNVAQINGYVSPNTTVIEFAKTKDDGTSMQDASILEFLTGSTPIIMLSGTYRI